MFFFDTFDITYTPRQHIDFKKPYPCCLDLKLRP